MCLGIAVILAAIAVLICTRTKIINIVKRNCQCSARTQGSPSNSGNSECDSHDEDKKSTHNLLYESDGNDEKNRTSNDHAKDQGSDSSKLEPASNVWRSQTRDEDFKKFNMNPTLKRAAGNPPIYSDDVTTPGVTSDESTFENDNVSSA